MSFLARVLRVPPPDQPAKHWHVSAPVDLLGYAFSWALVWIPLLFAGETRLEYIKWYLLVVALTDVHRHFGLPYVYMDKEIRSQYPLRFFFFPAILLGVWIASPWLVYHAVYVSGVQLAAILSWIFVLVQLLRRDGSESPIGFATLLVGLVILVTPSFLASAATAAALRGFDWGWWWLAAAIVASVVLERPVWRNKKIPFFTTGLVVLLGIAAAATMDLRGASRIWMGHVINGVAVFAGLWNFYHVYMQKYGIFRLYNAKSGNEQKVPGWVDKLLIFAWLPVSFVWLGTRFAKIILTQFHQARGILPDLIAFLGKIEAWAVPLFTLIPLGAAIVIWLVYEYRVNRLRNAPRFWMFLGTNMLGATLVVGKDPVKAYMAFAFSHAVEYMVFVWAFQRRRYHKPLPHRPLLQRVLRHPATAYVVFIAGLGVLFTYLKFYGGRGWNEGGKAPMAFGFKTSIWLLYWGYYQSMMHFYYDGFLWKMRKRSVRANI